MQCQQNISYSFLSIYKSAILGMFLEVYAIHFFENKSYYAVQNELKQQHTREHI